jgi:2-polyprenyl-6-methoxyphenol hydroxylase-like FAD-dependent oxidoreductase
LPQKETEEIFIQHLKNKGVIVEWNTELINISERKDHLLGTIKNTFQEIHMQEFSFVIACDGAHSVVREKLQIPFLGKEDHDQFVLGDLHVKGPISEHAISVFYEKNGVTLFIPLYDKHFRVIFNNASPLLEKDPLVDLHLLQKYACNRVPFNVQFSKLKWGSHFETRYRMTSLFQKGNVFLAGDAAHIHSPAGGQGMNTGLQDAYNLAWKLALHVKGKASSLLLASYEIERREIAKEVLSFTRTITRMVNFRHAFILRLRNFFIKCIFHFSVFEKKMLSRLSQLILHYATSPIVCEIPSKNAFSILRRKYRLFKRGPKAGQRALDGIVYVQGEEIPRRLFKLLEAGRHTLLIFLGFYQQGMHKQLELQIDKLRQWMSVHLSEESQILLVARDSTHVFFQTWQEGLLIDKEGHVHQLYKAFFPCVYLIRPDTYIGMRDCSLNLDLLKSYFAKILNI